MPRNAWMRHGRAIAARGAHAHRHQARHDAVLFRILLSLAKAVWTRHATTLLHDAMMLLGGNGIEERFSPLPRLYRDAVIMETWEGPHAVLYTQALNDLVRFDVDPAGLVERVQGWGAADAAAGGLVNALAAAVAADRRGDDGTVALAGLAPRLLGVRGAAPGPPAGAAGRHPIQG